MKNKKTRLFSCIKSPQEQFERAAKKRKNEKKRCVYIHPMDIQMPSYNVEKTDTPVPRSSTGQQQHTRDAHLGDDSKRRGSHDGSHQPQATVQRIEAHPKMPPLLAPRAIVCRHMRKDSTRRWCQADSIKHVRCAANAETKGEVAGKGGKWGVILSLFSLSPWL